MLGSFFHSSRPIVCLALIAAVVAGTQAASGDVLFEFQKPNHALGDRFGQTMTSIGNNVVISAPFDDTVGFGAGAAYMYDGAGQLLQTFYNPTPGHPVGAGSEYFGRSLGSARQQPPGGRSV